ncbi:hypothetical protein COO60DRAFT_296260 [Scenedesmus sp. NREL 46B-D3]|nr:hypothetical protein COO60DRAFT_296260 [Scenedesmus sp. NREL 46B-D3]
MFSPDAVLPAAAHGQGGSEHNMSATAAPGTMASRFSCSPLTEAQRASYFDLRGFSHPIHTPSPAAQALFDQGLLLAYNFNHPEALKSFQAGLRADPDSAMLHWGVVYALRCGVHAARLPCAAVCWLQPVRQHCVGPGAC